MTSWESYVTIASYISHEDIVKTSSTVSSSPDDIKTKYATPVLGLVADARTKGYDSVCLPLTTGKWKERWVSMCLVTGERAVEEGAADSSARESISRHATRESVIGVVGDPQVGKRAEEWRQKPAFTLDEVTVTKLEEAEGTTVMISDWLELDGPDDWIRHDAEIALQQELAYASYLGVHTVILPPPRTRAHVASYGRIVHGCLKKVSYMQLAIRLPIYNPYSGGDIITSPMSKGGSSTPASPAPGTPTLVVSDTTSTSVEVLQTDLNETWEMWDVIRSICDYDPRVVLMLDLTPLPFPTATEALSKWSAEPVKYIYLPSSTFIANMKGYPVLPKPTQTFIRDLMVHRPTVILSGTSKGRHGKGGEAVYAQYVRHLEKTSPAVIAAKKPGTVEHFAQGYQDYLQAPLQPLMDNLQSTTYQTFEQDPVKYRNYEEAMYQALMDWPPQDKVVFCIAGAGRGPIVQRCLNAIDRAKRPATVYAIEKNPNAFVTLQSRIRDEWGDRLTLLYGDMRHIEIPEKVDILVSELLGSFGDNELSPECLDGAMRFLKPNGISIPSSYTAHLAPLSSSKLYNEARIGKETKHLETPYVVMFQAINILSGDGGGVSGHCGSRIQECWEFVHPRRDAVLGSNGLPLTNSHNARSAKLTFHIPQTGILHGFAGYFEAVLYGNVGLSIHPERMGKISKDMLSWFPLFFPLKEPIYLPTNSELHVSLWRLTDQRQVWYEWHGEVFLCLPSGAATMTSIKMKARDSSSMAGVWSGSGVKGGGRHGSPNPGFGYGLGSPALGGGGMGGGLSLIGSPQMMASPLIDAVDLIGEGEHRSGSSGGGGGTGSGNEDRDDGGGIVGVGDEMELVKIGQTSLHNPGGRSSWIGL